MDSVIRMTAIAALLSSLGVAVQAHAGLGPIRVLSSEGEPFEAEIPLVDEAVGANASIGLADRNHYPLISPYTPSVGKLQFSLVRQADGMLSKVRVAGPANFDEPTLHFAVEISWPAGRLVREFDVDYRRDGPRHPKRAPLSDDEGKKAAVTADHHARLTPLGLGELKVQSSIGEPLLAEVEVLGRPPAEHKQLSAVVLPSGEVRAQQVQLLASIGYEFVKSASGKTVLRLFSSQIVQEPMLSLRLEVGVGTIKLARNYSLFFDPPETARQIGRVSREESADVDHHAAKTKVYRVGRGDTLGAIAQRTEGGGAVEQVIRRLHAANPQAFIAGDVDRLKAGAQLSYPANWRIAEAPPGGNKATVKEHSAAPAPAPAPAQLAAAVPATAPVAAPPAATSVPVVGDKVVQPSSGGQREAQLKRRLQQQDQLLAVAEQRLQALQQRLNTLQQEAAHPAPVKAPTTKAEPVKNAAGLESEVMESLGRALGDNSPYVYSAGAAGVVLLGGGWWWLRRRRNRPAGSANGLVTALSVGANPSLLTMGPLTTLMAGGKQGGGIDLSPVDLVAEAEVYLAYGRTDQALALLREGLTREPMRQDVRFKLLEALSALPDKQPFVLEATAAKGVFGKDSTLWQRVCELGRVTLPGNPLFDMEPLASVEGAGVPAAASIPAAGAVARVAASAAVAGDGAAVPTPSSLAAGVPLAAEVPQSVSDKQELARLYMEMGDTEAAKALLKESEDSA